MKAAITFLFFAVCEVVLANSAPAKPTDSSPPPAALSHSELRERYRKRLEELARAKEPVPGSPEAPPSEKDLREMLAALKDRDKRLADREAQIETKERDLKEKQTFLQQQLGKYEATLAKLRLELKSLEETKEGKIAAFRQVYEKMEAKKAARILDDMDPDLTSKILAGMKQQQAAEILAKMDPEKARRITKRFLSSVNKTSE